MADSSYNTNSLNLNKVKQYLHYIIHKTDQLDNVGKTVLYKILYFTDFNYYELFEKKLSSETYLKYPFGPAPSNFDLIIEELQNKGLIKEYESGYGPYCQVKYRSLVDPETSEITDNELYFIDKSINDYSHLNATKISEHSHHDTPYLAAEDFEELDYEMVFYRTSELSVRNYDDEADNN